MRSHYPFSVSLFGGGQFEMYNLNGYIQALKDEEAWVRAVAALALGQIGKPAKPN